MMKKQNKRLAIFLLAIVSIFAFSFSLAAAEGTSPGVTLEIDYGEYDEDNLPVGKAGLSYGVFDYSAKNENGEEITDVSVYVYSPDGKIVPVVGGRFETKSAGKYKIEYVAKNVDAVDKKTVEITVTTENRPLVYKMSDKNVYAANTGTTVFVYDGEFSGGIGLVGVKTKVTLGETANELEKTESGYCFTPKKSGNYVLSYVLTDFAGQKEEFTKTITVTDSKKPILGVPSVRKSITVGDKAFLPVVDGILYDGDNVYYLPVKVSVDGADVTEKMEFTPETAGVVAVKYVCENPFDKSFKEELTFDVEVVADTEGELVFNKHFILDNMESVSSSADSVYVLATKNSGNASFGFDSALPVQYLDIGLKGGSSAGDYSAMRLVLTDMKNAADKVVVTLPKIDTFESFYAKYDDDKKVIADIDGKTIAELKHYADGRKFEGFKSGKAYISVEIIDASADTQVILDTIGKHNVTTATSDFGSPMFLDNPVFRSVNTTYINETIELPLMKAFDLFEATVKVSVTITSPDKKVVYSGEMTEPYLLKTDKYGTYTVRYTASDSVGNARPLVCSVYCTDIIPPEISVGQMPSVVSVGQTVTIPVATVTDNSTAENKILAYVYVYYGNNIRTLVTGDSYTFKEAGVYKIRYVAYDAFENYSIAEFTVVCK